MRKSADWKWPLNDEKIVKRHFHESSVVFFRTESGKSNTKIKIKNEHIAICYIYSCQTFIVWNASIHRFLHQKSASVTFDCGAQARALLKDGIKNNEIISIYKPLSNSQYPSCVEKILLIGKNALFEFCQNYEEYLYPLTEDIPHGKTVLFATPEDLQPLKIDGSIPDQIARSRIATSKTKRDSQFRKLILSKYHSTCVVCGSTEEKQLQAAHIISVEHGGNDSVENGICLCANHHLLYDAGLLDIDLKRKTFVCHSVTEKQMPWYKMAEQNQCRLILKENDNEKT